MRMKSLLGSTFFYGLACCTQAPAPDPGAATPPAATPTASGASAKSVVFYFHGTVDTVRGTMDIAVRPPVGTTASRTPEDTLSYGYSTGHVYFHTCNTSLTASTFGGDVSAINLMTGSIHQLDAVIDSISATGVTLATGDDSGATSGVIASYGNVAPNAVNCDSPTTWTFSLPTPTTFTFEGHAEGMRDRIIFATKTKYSGDLVDAVPGSTSGVDAANKLCNQAAAASTIPTVSGSTFEAWISDSTTSPSVTFAQDGDFVGTDGAFLAQSWGDLTSDKVASGGISRDENGALIPKEFTFGSLGKRSVVMTATFDDGTPLTDPGETCNDWTGAAGEAPGQAFLNGNSSWSVLLMGPQSGPAFHVKYPLTVDCSNAVHHLLCFQM